FLDEEGESSYKSETTPRYHAREIAKFRAVKHNATLVLGSATPCIESYYYAKTGRYSLFTLDKRYKNAKLPSVFIVDMTKEPLSMSPLSQALEAQIEVNLKNNEQTILLINRRGYHTYASCMQCGDVIKCPNCDVSLTYHKSKETLMCHYCGFQESFDVKCPSCGGKYISFSGIGTQKLEDYLIKRFEGVRILRMDGDTTTKKDSYIKAFTEFDKGNYDIMVGTQMVAKGLDFPNVTLVGIINADSGLYSADYKSTERIFSLITQVVGRSGRSQKSGRAYIQSLNPENSVILKAASQNYNDFFDEEIAIRKIMTYPPFCDICVIGFSGINEKNTIKSAEAVLSMLSKLSCKAKGITMKVLGITPANIYKINNKYRYRIIIKCKYTNTFKQFISKVLKSVSINNVSVFVDINGDIN
ncbi:MAG: primosomal protein N', partial [Oscillospiraceae bacterium]